MSLNLLNLESSSDEIYKKFSRQWYKHKIDELIFKVRSSQNNGIHIKLMG